MPRGQSTHLFLAAPLTNAVSSVANSKPIVPTQGGFPLHLDTLHESRRGAFVKELQQERTIDRDKLAEALETDGQSISKIEHGSLRMTAGELILMIEHFDLPWDDFIARVRTKLVEADKLIR